MTKAEYLEDLASRRKVVQLLLTSSFGALFLSVAYPILRYLVPPTIGEPRVASVEVPWTAAELKPNSGRIFRFGSRPGILIKTPGGAPRLHRRLHPPGLHRAVPGGHADDLVRLP